MEWRQESKRSIRNELFVVAAATVAQVALTSFGFLYVASAFAAAVTLFPVCAVVYVGIQHGELTVDHTNPSDFCRSTRV